VQLQNEFLKITLERAELLRVLFNDAGTDTQLILYKVIVPRVLSYGCENWKIHKAEKRRSETAEKEFLTRVPCHSC
jgi:hypothetical protein